jgi:predicted MFS family arabinose efflux permease
MGTAQSADRWSAVAVVALGIFVIVTVEILPIGLLTPIAADFDVSDGTAGLLMTMPGLLAAIAAPTVTVATARIERRLMLVALIAVLAVADFLAASAPNFAVTMIARVLVGMTIGAFWSISAGLAERLVNPGSTSLANSIIFSAVPLGSVLGVPLGTFIGDAFGWRSAFFAAGLLTVLVLVAIPLTVPNLPATAARTTARSLTKMAARPGIRTGVAVTFLVVQAHFGTYTYIRPFLQNQVHAGPMFIAALLLLYGIAGMIGNFVAGRYARRRPRRVLAIAGALLAIPLVLLSSLGANAAFVVVLVTLWGLAYGAVPVSSQAWFAAASPDTPEAASVYFTAVFQATISLGALAGGVVLDHTSTGALLLTGGLVAGTLVLTAIASAPPGDTGPSGATPAGPVGKPGHPRRPEAFRGRRRGR